MKIPTIVADGENGVSSKRVLAIYFACLIGYIVAFKLDSPNAIGALGIFSGTVAAIVGVQAITKT